MMVTSSPTIPALAEQFLVFGEMATINFIIITCIIWDALRNNILFIMLNQLEYKISIRNDFFNATK